MTRSAGTLELRAARGRWTASSAVTFGTGAGRLDGVEYTVGGAECRLMVGHAIQLGRVDGVVELGPTLTLEQHDWASTARGDISAHSSHLGAVAMGTVWVPVPVQVPWVYLTIGGGIALHEAVTGYRPYPRDLPSAWGWSPMIEIGLSTRRW